MENCLLFLEMQTGLIWYCWVLFDHPWALHNSFLSLAKYCSSCQSARFEYSWCYSFWWCWLTIWCTWKTRISSNPGMTLWVYWLILGDMSHSHEPFIVWLLEQWVLTTTLRIMMPDGLPTIYCSWKIRSEISYFTGELTAGTGLPDSLEPNLLNCHKLINLRYSCPYFSLKGHKILLICL